MTLVEKLIEISSEQAARIKELESTIKRIEELEDALEKLIIDSDSGVVQSYSARLEELTGLKDEADSLCECQYKKIEALESTIKINLPHFKYAIDCLTKDGINPGPLTDIYKALVATQEDI